MIEFGEFHMAIKTKFRHMNKIINFCLYLLITALLLNCSSPTNSNSCKYTLTLNFPEISSNGWKATYVAWIEDLDGNNIQNLYICKKLLTDIISDPSKLEGDPLPYWRKNKLSIIDLSQVDAVSGASIQKSFKIARELYISNNNSEIRVCLEIDRAKNGNEYFDDRPSFIYKTDTIDLNNLKDSYSLKLNGFMADKTSSKGFAQNPPIKPIPDFSPWKYNTAIQYIYPTNMFINETPESSHLTVEITQ